MINDSFISEVKSRWRWRARRRGGCLSPPRKLHGKEIYLKDGPLRIQNALLCIRNVFQRRSLKKEFRMHCYAFEMYLKDSSLRSSECIDLRNAVPKRRSLKEFRLFFLLNVCFKIFCRKYQMPRERRRRE